MERAIIRKKVTLPILVILALASSAWLGAEALSAFESPISPISPIETPAPETPAPDGKIPATPGQGPDYELPTPTPDCVGPTSGEECAQPRLNGTQPTPGGTQPRLSGTGPTPTVTAEPCCEIRRVAQPGGSSARSRPAEELEKRPFCVGLTSGYLLCYPLR